MQPVSWTLRMQPPGKPIQSTDIPAHLLTLEGAVRAASAFLAGLALTWAGLALP